MITRDLRWHDGSSGWVTPPEYFNPLGYARTEFEPSLP